MAPDARIWVVDEQWRSLLAVAYATVWLGFAVVYPVSAEAPGSDNRSDHIPQLIESWFSLLEKQPPDSSAMDHFAGASPLAFPLYDGVDPGAGEFTAWIADLRTHHRNVEYRLSEIRTEVAGDGLYRAQFEVDRRSVDGDEMPHVARRRYTWLIREQGYLEPAVVRIEEERVLHFPGTGPQIVCY
jgi:hypothetical protein